MAIDFLRRSIHRPQVLTYRHHNSNRFSRRSAFAFEALEDRLAPAIIVWDGDGNDFNWNNPLNWSGDVGPSTADIAIINDADITVTKTGNNTIQAVQSAASLVLSGGSLTVTSGASQIDGDLTINGGSLFVRGATASFTSTAEVILDGASLFADQGGILALAGAASYSGRSTSTTIQATQGGSIDLSGITSLSGGQSFATLSVNATGGGTIDLGNLQTYTSGSMRVAVDGATSLVDLSNLPELFSDAFSNSRLEVRNKGVIRVDSLGSANRVDIVASGADTEFSSTSLTNIDGSSLFADLGGTIRLPQVVSYTGQTFSTQFVSSGTGSLIDLSGLTTLTAGQSVASLSANATSGGQIDLQSLDYYLGGSFRVLADGDGSLVDLRDLPLLYSEVFSNSRLEVRNKGVIRLDSLGSATRVDIVSSGADTEFSSTSLADIDGSNLFANDGGTIRLPQVVSYTGQTFSTQFASSGAGSLIDLSGLTTLTAGQSFATVSANATGGGQIDLQSLANYLGGAFRVLSDGTGSLVDLRDLPLLFSDAFTNSVLEVRNQGAIRLDILGSVTRVDVIARGADTLFSSTSLTNIDGSNLFADQGGTIRLPQVVSYSGQAFSTQFAASGAGSLIDLSNLTTLNAGQSFATVSANATAGGQIDLQSLANYLGGAFRVLSENIGSFVDLRDLPLLFSDAFTNSVLEVRNQGAIRLDILGSVTRVDVIARGANTLFSSTSLTNIDGSNLFADQGGTIRLPQVVSYSGQAFSTQFAASGAGSLIDLSNLTTLNAGQSFATVSANATAGGQIDLQSLANYLGGAFRVLAGDLGQVDLRSLPILFSDAFSTSQLEVRNAGAIRADSLATISRVDIIARGAGTLFQSDILTNIDGSNLIADSGGTVRLPSVVTYSGQEFGTLFQSNGAGSLIELPNLQTLRGGLGFAILSVQALSGGKVDLDTVSTYAGGATTLRAEGTGSVIEFTGISTFFSDQAAFSSLEARTGANILLTPDSLELVRVNVVAENTGTISAGLLRLFNETTISGNSTIVADVLNASGRIIPGLIAYSTLTIDGNFRQLATGLTDIRFRGTTAGIFDRLIVTGAAQLDGTLALSKTVDHPLGQSYDIITAGILDGVYSTITGQSAGATTRFFAVYGSTTVRLDTVDATTLKVTAPAGPVISNQSLTSLVLTLSAPVADDGARDSANYQLVRLGDTPVSVPVLVTYVDGSTQVTLSFAPLQAGDYELTVQSGNPGLRDLSGNPLDGDANGTSGGGFVLPITIDTLAPQVSNATLEGQQIQVEFDDNVGMKTSSVVLAGNYRLIASGADGIFGNGNDIDLSSRIGGLAFDTVTSSVLLSLLEPIGIEAYQLTVKSGIQDQAGNALESDFVIVFDLAPGVPFVVLPEDAQPSVLDLKPAFPYFNSPTYEITDVSNPELFTKVELDQLLQTLTLEYAPNATGFSLITLRVTEGNTLAGATVVVRLVPINDPPTTVGIPDVSVTKNAADTLISLFPLFDDLEDDDSQLTFSIVGNSDQSLFDSVTIDDATGTLTLSYTTDAIGVSNVTVRVTDAEGGFVDSTFVVTIFEANNADRFEANDTLATATDLGSVAAGDAATVNANIHTQTDIDFYQIQLTSAGVLTLETFADRLGSPLDTLLTLYAADGRVIAQSDDTIGRDSTIKFDLAAGIYFVSVADYVGTVGSYRLNYQLQNAGPQVLRMTPSTTLGQTPTQIILLLDDLDSNNLDPATIDLSAFALLRINANGQVLADASTQLTSVFYDSSADSLTLALTGNLPEGRYRLVASDSIRSVSGTALDGDRDGVAGGDFVGTFAIDTTAPNGIFSATSVAGGNNDGIFYVFSGTLQDSFPAVAGETVLVLLDVDGDGEFDDGSQSVVLGNGPTNFVVTATTAIAGGQGIKTVSARFVDSRGNVSNPTTAMVDTDLPQVVDVRIVNGTFQVTFNRGELRNVMSLATYAVSGLYIDSITYDIASRTATLIPILPLFETSYTVTIFSGTTTGINASSIALDGDRDLAPGGDFIVTLTVDNTAPVVQSVRLSPLDDNLSGTPDDARTNTPLPAFELKVLEVFPDTSTGTITVNLDVDGDGMFDDGTATVIVNEDTVDENGVTTVTVQSLQALPEGISTIRFQVVDASGNLIVTANLVVTVDLTAPVATGITQVLVPGVASGLVYTLDFDEPMDLASLLNLANYQLIAAGGDRSFDEFNESDATFALSIDLAKSSATRVVLTADLAGNGLGTDDYRLIVNGSSVTDRAGNGLAAANVIVDAAYDLQRPIVVANATILASALVDQLPDRVFVQFGDVDLNTTDAQTPQNYVLTNLQNGQAVPITAAVYDSFADRVILSGFGPLGAGNYRLDVANIRNTTGFVLQPFTILFTVTPPATEVDLNEQVLQGNANSLQARASEVIPKLDASTKVIASQVFADRLATQILQSIRQGGVTNDIVRQTVEREIIAEFGTADFLPPEFVIVWSSGARFLLFDPTDDPSSAADRARIGIQLDGNRLQELDDALLFGDPNSDSGIQIAIVPVNLRTDLISNELATVNGQPIFLPDLNYTIELEAFADAAQAGIVYFGSRDVPGNVAAQDLTPLIPQIGIQKTTLDLSDTLQGFDPNINLFNQEVIANIVNVFGDLSNLAENLLVLWFDPVDFILADVQGVRSGRTGFDNQTYRQAASTFYSEAADGFTELLVRYAAPADVYDLALFGVGDFYRGAANFWPAHTDNIPETAPLQGLLSSLDRVDAILNFGFLGGTPGPVTNPPPPPVTPPGQSPTPGTPGTPGTPNNPVNQPSPFLSLGGGFLSTVLSTSIAAQLEGNDGDDSDEDLAESVGLVTVETDGGSEGRGDQENPARARTANSPAAQAPPVQMLDNFFDFLGDLGMDPGLFDQSANVIGSFFPTAGALLKNLLNREGGSNQTPPSAQSPPSPDQSNNSSATETQQESEGLANAVDQVFSEIRREGK